MLHTKICNLHKQKTKSLAHVLVHKYWMLHFIYKYFQIYIGLWSHTKKSCWNNCMQLIQIKQYTVHIHVESPMVWGWIWLLSNEMYSISPNLGKGIKNTQRVGWKSNPTQNHRRFFWSHVITPLFTLQNFSVTF